jgi:hypothetical protein
MLLCVGLLFAACAAPEIRLQPRFATGEVRDYRLVADAVVRIDAATTSQVERSQLIANTRLAVESVTAGVATILLTITPRSLTRDGKRSDVPAAQQVRMTVAADGRVTDVTPLGQQTTLETADIEDLVPLIGPPVPRGRVHLADRWSRRSSVSERGTQNARLAALRTVDGYDCAIVATSTRRPVSRERNLGGSTLRLDGVEYASGEISFAFAQGFPVSVKSDAEARLAVSGAGGQGGGVVISTVTTLTLTRRTLS